MAQLMTPPSAAVLDRLKAAVGEGGWSDDPDRIAPKLREWRDRWIGTTPLLLLPSDPSGCENQGKDRIDKPRKSKVAR